MAADERHQPAVSEAAKRRQDEQRDRLAAALRDNLKKRKQQTRVRTEDKEDPS